MLPRDESAAFAIDDTILLARIISNHIDYPLETSFQVYDSLRRSDIAHAFKDSAKLWQRRNTDAGPIETWFRERLIPFQIKHEMVSRKAAFEYDASKAAIPSLSRNLSPLSSLRTSDSKSRLSLSSHSTMPSSGNTTPSSEGSNSSSSHTSHLRKYSSCGQPEMTKLMSNLVVIEK